MSKLIEEWRPVVGYEGLYEVSDWGNVRSTDKTVIDKNGRKICLKGMILKQTIRGDKRCSVTLSKNGIEKQRKVHRLVGEAFIDNNCNLPQINHIDENPSNNNVSNLEWCDSKYNNTYNDRHIKIGEQFEKKVEMYDLEDNYITTFDSLTKAAKCVKTTKGNIGNCCNGGFFNKKRNKWVNVTKAAGYKWKYADTTKTNVIPID